MKRALAFLIFLLLPAVALAQAVKKIPVAVQHVGDDQVGQAFAFALKEAIRASQSFQLVDDEPRPFSARIVVHLVSASSSGAVGDSSWASAIGQTIVYHRMDMPGAGVFLGTFLNVCGQFRVKFCAESLLPDIDRAVELFRKGWPDLWKTL